MTRLPWWALPICFSVSCNTGDRTICSPQWVLFNIEDAIREEIKTIPDFRYGAIGVMFVPRSDEATAWMSQLGIETGQPRYSEALMDAGYTRPIGWRGSEVELDCLGDVKRKLSSFASVKGAMAGDNHEYEYLLPGGNEPRFGEKGGRMHYEILCEGEVGEIKRFLDIYVAVSGAEGEENQQCALAAEPVIERMFDDGSIVEAFWGGLERPFYRKRKRDHG